MPHKEKSPALAALGSFFFPGLGQVYDGKGMLKGLLYAIGIMIGSIVLVIPGILIWIYGVYNAYSVAKKINSGLEPYKDVSAVTLILYVVLYWIVLFIYIAIISIVFFLFSAVIIAFMSSMSGGYY